VQTTIREFLQGREGERGGGGREGENGKTRRRKEGQKNKFWRIVRARV